MRWDRVLLVIGIALLATAAGTLVTGSIAQTPVVTIGLLVLATVVLGAGLMRARSAPEHPLPAEPDPSRRRAIDRIVVLGLGAMGTVALVVALTVAEGEAQGHAVGHLVTGAVALGLFAALAFPWHPQPGTSTSFVRLGCLWILAVGAFGSFLESLGGAGYDAANAGRRIAALASMHNVAAPIAALGVLGVPLGAIVGLGVLTTWAVRRVRRSTT